MKRGRLLVLTVLAYGCWVGAYQLVGSFASTRPPSDLTTALDRALPFVPEAIWIYETCYLLPFLVVAVVPDARTLRVTLSATILANFLAFACFILFPVSFEQPPLGTSLSERMLAVERAFEFTPNANNMPSLHVVISVLAWLGAKGGLEKLWSFLLLALVVAISLSTVLVKQHIVLDVVTGALLAVASYATAERALDITSAGS